MSEEKLVENFWMCYYEAMRRLVLLTVEKAPLLTGFQLERLASVCVDLVQISVASVVVPFLFDKPNSSIVLLGTLSALLFWSISLFVERKRI